MTKCTDRGCRNLEWKCADCGRVASQAEFGAQFTQNQWISFQNKSPSQVGPYLVYYTRGDQMRGCDKGAIRVAYWMPLMKDGISVKYRWERKGSASRITHWMPLPEAPE